MFARENETVSDTCYWDIVFETNTGAEVDAGRLPLLTTAFYDMDNSTYGNLSTNVVEVCLTAFLCALSLPGGSLFTRLDFF